MIQIITKYKINGQEKHQLKGLTLSQGPRKASPRIQQLFKKRFNRNTCQRGDNAQA